MTLFVDTYISIKSYESCKYCNGNLYAGIVKDFKNQQLFMDLYVSIATDVKKINYYLQGLEASIVMNVKKPTTIYEIYM
jgi:hypothetical protein